MQFDSDFTTSFTPNPVADNLKNNTNTDWANERIIKLFNMSGKAVHTSGSVPEQEISVRNLSDGVYVVYISLSNGTTHSVKIVVAK